MLRIKVRAVPGQAAQVRRDRRNGPVRALCLRGRRGGLHEHIPNDHTQPEWTRHWVPLPGDGFSAALTIQILDYDKKATATSRGGRVDLRSHIAAWASAEGMEGAEVRPLTNTVSAASLPVLSARYPSGPAADTGKPPYPVIWHTEPVDLSLTSSVLGVQPLQALSEEGADAGMLVAGLKSCEVECSGHKSKAGSRSGSP